MDNRNDAKRRGAPRPVVVEVVRRSGVRPSERVTRTITVGVEAVPTKRAAPTASAPAPKPNPPPAPPPKKPKPPAYTPSPYGSDLERQIAARTRGALRAIERLGTQEQKIIDGLVAGGAAGGGPWHPDVARHIAKSLDVPRQVLNYYLSAMRRTPGLSVRFKCDASGPMVRDAAWVEHALRTRNWGAFQPLLSPGWDGFWTPGPPEPGEEGKAPKRFATRPPETNRS